MDYPWDLSKDAYHPPSIWIFDHLMKEGIHREEKDDKYCPQVCEGAPSGTEEKEDCAPGATRCLAKYFEVQHGLSLFKPIPFELSKSFGGGIR